MWAAATTLGALTLLVEDFTFLDTDYWMVLLACIAALSLIIVCYVTIRARLTFDASAIVANIGNSLEKNRKLFKSLFIVIDASLDC